MAVKTSLVEVTDEPTALNAAGPGQTLRIRNTDTEDGVDLGDATVKTAEGYPLAKEGVETFELDAGDVLYAVAAEGKEVTLAVLST